MTSTRGHSIIVHLPTYLDISLDRDGRGIQMQSRPWRPSQSITTRLAGQGNATTTTTHRHLREIDRSSAIVGGPAAAWAMALKPG